MPENKKRSGRELPRTDAPFMTRLITKLAKRMKATVILEPEFRYVGQIIFRNGKRTFFRNRVLSINTLSAVEVARDKNYSAFFLRRFGYRVPEERTFFSDAWCKTLKSRRNVAAACAYAKKLGFPVIVKPNHLSQGALVTKARTVREVRAAAREILRRSNMLLVQRFLPGRDYRVVVMDDQIISAYERLPLTITGTGTHTVRQLMARKQREFERGGRDTILQPDDFRIAWKLKSQNLTFRSVPKRGQEVRLLDNANLSTGGDSTDVTPDVHPDYQQLAVRLTKDMGLRLCGVDIITSDITAPLDPSYCILEINAAPGLDHYASSGRRQQTIVEELYLQVLKAIEKGA